jgi:hypothetical protein
VFEAADAANAKDAGPFERRVVTLPRLFQEPNAGSSEWPTSDAEVQPAAWSPGDRLPRLS